MSKKKLSAIYAEIEEVRSKFDPESDKDRTIAIYVHFYNRVVNIIEYGAILNKPRKCFRCGGDMIPNTLLREVDYDCFTCRRGWKFFEKKWYSRSTATQEIYDEEGNQLQ